MLLPSRKNSVQVDHLVEVNDLVKFFRNERRATNESAINIRARHELVDVVWCYRPAVLDANRICRLLVIHLGEPRSDVGMYVLCLLRRCSILCRLPIQARMRSPPSASPPCSHPQVPWRAEERRPAY